MKISEEILLDLFWRMAEHIDNGMDRDAAFVRAAQELEEDLRMLAAAQRQALREHDITVH